MIFGGTEINSIAQIHLILEGKVGDDLYANQFKNRSKVRAKQYADKVIPGRGCTAKLI